MRALRRHSRAHEPPPFRPGQPERLHVCRVRRLAPRAPASALVADPFSVFHRSPRVSRHRLPPPPRPPASGNQSSRVRSCTTVQRPTRPRAARALPTPATAATRTYGRPSGARDASPQHPLEQRDSPPVAYLVRREAKYPPPGQYGFVVLFAVSGEPLAARVSTRDPRAALDF